MLNIANTLKPKLIEEIKNNIQKHYELKHLKHSKNEVTLNSLISHFENNEEKVNKPILNTIYPKIEEDEKIVISSFNNVN